ncbi:MAG: carbohydrate kinase family protein [Chloroflexi bacterium]|nr:MAG: carbohydrate kinase family protein [Chloroflexota bacterium]
MGINTPRYICGGGIRIDYIIRHDGRVHNGIVGGNALYAAVGAALWTQNVAVWGRVGVNYPQQWLNELSKYGLDTSSIIQLDTPQDHRTFYAYLPDGRREDTNPAYHFARIGHPLPEALHGYIHSTPGQDNPHQYEPLALRPDDWPTHFDPLPQRPTVVHLSPLALSTHLHLPPFLRQRGVGQITADPGERYMQPDNIPWLRQFLPHLDAFLPSEQEIRTLFGPKMGVWEAAETLCDWGVPLVVIKLGAKGVIMLEGKNGRRTELPAIYQANDPRVVDVTGAGDAFCGGFMVGLAQTGSPRQAAQMGLQSAARVLEGYGALYALQNR